MPLLKYHLNGEAQTFDLDGLNIVNPVEDGEKVSAQIAYWGVVTAEADAVAERLDAEIDGWESRGLAGILKRVEGTAEWKAKALVRELPEYAELKKRLADAKEFANKARSVYISFIKKHDMLKVFIQPYASHQAGSDDRLSGFKASRQKKAAEER